MVQCLNDDTNLKLICSSTTGYLTTFEINNNNEIKI